MSNKTVEELLEAFKKDQWKVPNIYNKALELRHNPDEAYLFLEQYLVTFEGSATVFDDLVGYLNKHQLSSLLELVFNEKKLNIELPVIESLIDYIALMSPTLLHPYLEKIATRECRSYTAYYPWRDLDINGIEKWKERLQQAEQNKEKMALVEMLLETRDQKTVIYAYNYAKAYQLKSVESLIYYLEAVGYTLRDNEIINYCPTSTYHMIFKPNYILKDKVHPTWNVTSETLEYAMGGEMPKSDKENPFCHIITLDPIPKNLNIGLNRLTLAMHPRELNEGYEIFYQHNSQGEPSKIESTETLEITFSEDMPIKNTTITLASTPSFWNRQDWGCGSGTENLFRVGGEPSWIQSADVPKCIKCHKKMNYIMQLDSELPTISNGELWFGSGGIAYTFWCDKCFISSYTIQFT